MALVALAEAFRRCMRVRPTTRSGRLVDGDGDGRKSGRVRERKSELGRDVWSYGLVSRQCDDRDHGLRREDQSMVSVESCRTNEFGR